MIENCNNCYIKDICYTRQTMIPDELKIKKVEADTQIKTFLEDKKCIVYKKGGVNE